MNWRPDWTGRTAAVVASGPSASDAPLHLLADVPTICINESWRLLPTADAVYASDGGWWNERKGLPEFGGLKITQDAGAAARYGLHHVALGPRGRATSCRFYREPGPIGWGRNSGFQAVNLAIQFGATRIVLIGFDMRSVEGRRHWHPDHEAPLRNPKGTRFDVWRKLLDDQGPLLREWGVEVLNASPASALTAYPKVSLEEALCPTPNC